MQVERAREQIQYKLGLQQNLKRAEELAHRAQLERLVDGVQTRLALKLTEERANLQAAQVCALAGTGYLQPAHCSALLSNKIPRGARQLQAMQDCARAGSTTHACHLLASYTSPLQS